MRSGRLHCCWCGSKKLRVAFDRKHPYSNEENAIKLLLELLGLSSNLLKKDVVYRICQDCFNLVSYGTELNIQLQLGQTPTAVEQFHIQLEQVKTDIKNRTHDLKTMPAKTSYVKSNGIPTLGSLLSRCFTECVVQLCPEDWIPEEIIKTYRTIDEEWLQQSTNAVLDEDETDSKDLKIKLGLPDEASLEALRQVSRVDCSPESSYFVSVKVEVPEDQQEEKFQLEVDDLDNEISPPKTENHDTPTLRHLLDSETLSVNNETGTTLPQQELQSPDMGIQVKNAFSQATEQHSYPQAVNSMEEKLHQLGKVKVSTSVVRILLSSGSRRTNSQPTSDIPLQRKSPKKPKSRKNGKNKNLQSGTLETVDTSSKNPESEEITVYLYDPVSVNEIIRKDKELAAQAENDKSWGKEDAYECVACLETFQSIKGKANHEETHKVRRKRKLYYKCGICAEEVSCRLVKLHKQKHLTPVLHECDICMKTFQEMDAFVIHRRVCSIEWFGFDCEVCDRRFRSKTALVMHRKIHSDVRGNREQCRKLKLPKAKRDKAEVPTPEARSNRKTGNMNQTEDEMKFDAESPGYEYVSVDDIINRASVLEDNENSGELLGHSDSLSHKECQKEMQSSSPAVVNMEFEIASASEVHKKPPPLLLPFDCHYCDQIFDTKIQLRLHHQKKHIREKPYQCEVCDKKFSTKGTLILHRRIHTGEKPYECGDCGQRFAQKYKVVIHRRTHTGERPYECNICQQKFKQPHHLAFHKRSIHREGRKVRQRKVYECNICSKKLRSNFELLRHSTSHSNEKPFKCKLCEAAFKKKESLYHHHDKLHLPFKCRFCPQKFPKYFNLENHEQRMHSAERMNQGPQLPKKPILKCHICNKKFKTKWRAVRHSLTHGDDKPFKCQLCEQSFIRKDELKYHHEKMHNPSVKKPFECDFCDKKFAEKNILDGHLVVHTGEKTFQVSLL